MDMTGEYRIAAPRARVWTALNDPEILKQCIPGCESIDQTTPTEWTAKVVAKVGPVKASFAGKVVLGDLDPPNGYTITGEGTGGAAGFAKGSAAVKLTDDGAGTLLAYTVKASIGGKLAQIGSRLIDGTARKMADEFFARFVEIVATAEADANAASSAASNAASGTAPMPASAAIVHGIDAAAAASLAGEGTTPLAVGPDPHSMRPRPGPGTPGPGASPPGRGSISPMVWAVGVTAAVAAILYFFVFGGSR